MPVIQSPPQPSTETFPRVARWVEVKQNWVDQWAPLPYWVPLRARIEIAPGHGSASFGRWLGRVQPEGETAKQLFLPADLVDWYCRIMICHPAQQPVPIWTGIIPDSTVLVDSPTVGRAQNLEAFGLTWLLDRTQITTSWANQNGSLVEVSQPLTFNRRNPGRGLSLAGNRSKDKDSTLKCYVFQGGTNGNRVWSNRDIAEYLLATYGRGAPAGVKFELAGMTAALDSMKNEWKQSGTAWQMLNQLVDKRNGLVFYPRVTSASKVALSVTSETEVDINYGGVTLPKNPVQVSFTLPTTGAEQHLPLDTTCRFTAIARYDELRILGNNVIMMFTVSKLDGTLDKGWTTAAQVSYEAAGGLTDPEQADEFRRQWKFTDVYTRFIVPPAWNGNVRDGTGGTTAYPVTPTPKDDGTLDQTKQGAFLRAFKTFARELVIEKGKRYDVIPVENTNDPDAEPELRPIFAAVLDDFDGANHKATNKWIRLDKLGSGHSGMHNLSVATLDKDLGFRIHCQQQHYIAGEDWDPANKTTVMPEINWRSILITACMVTDVRPQIVKRLTSTPTENRKVKTIEVAGAEFWFAAEKTVVDSDGGLVRIEKANQAIRDDVEKLRAAAAFAEVWYAKQRQAVSIPIQTLGQFVELGTYLTGISNAYMWLPVGTIVTGVEWDFAAPSTTITTGSGGDDMMLQPVEFVGKVKGRSRGR